MVGIILLVVFAFVLVMLTAITYYLRTVVKEFDAQDEKESDIEKKKAGILSAPQTLTPVRLKGISDKSFLQSDFNSVHCSEENIFFKTTKPHLSKLLAVSVLNSTLLSIACIINGSLGYF